MQTRFYALIPLLAFAATPLRADTFTAGETSKQAQICTPGFGCGGLGIKGKKSFATITYDVTGIPNFTDKMTSNTRFELTFGPNDSSGLGYAQFLNALPGYTDGATSVRFRASSKPRVDYALSWNNTTFTVTMKAKGDFSPFTSTEFDLPAGNNLTQVYTRLELTGPFLADVFTQAVPATTAVKARTKTKSDGTSTTVKLFNKFTP